MSAEGTQPWSGSVGSEVAETRNQLWKLSWLFLTGAIAVPFPSTISLPPTPPRVFLPHSWPLQKLLKLETRQPVFLEALRGCLEVVLEKNVRVLKAPAEQVREREEKHVTSL